MQYTNYAMKNNVFGTLSAPISSLATTIQLNTGQGARFTTDMLATLESMEGNKVTKREIVKITNVSGDTLTVIRKFAPCPSNDDANTQGQVSYSFSADDTISVYISKEHFDKIDSSINDLYDNGVNKLRTEVVSGLQISVGAGPVLVGNSYYDFAGDTITLTNNATNYVEIDEDGDLVANTTAWGDKNTKIAKVVTSGGAVTSIEDRRLGTVGGKIGGIEIHELTEKERLSPDDEFIVADSDNIYQNKKILYGKLFGQGPFICGENIAKGDIVAIENYRVSKHYNLGADGATQSTTIGNGQKIAQAVFGSGEAIKYLSFVGKLTSTSTTLNIRIETDNNGVPSGTLANANATHNLLTSEATTTEALINIEFDNAFALTKGQKYWVVFSGGTSSNFAISCEGYNHTECLYATDGVNYNVSLASHDYYEGKTTGSGTENYFSQGFSYTITPNQDFYLYSFKPPIDRYSDYSLVGFSIAESGNTLASGTGETATNIQLLSGHTYTITISNNNRYLWYTKATTFAVDGGWCSVNVPTVGNNWYPKFLGSFGYTSKPLSLLLDSGLFGCYIKKVNKLFTYKEIGIAQADYNEGEMGYIYTKGNICVFNNVDFVPGDRYIWDGVNFTKDDGTRFDGNNICIGLAINKNTIILELDQIYSNTDPTILLTAKNGYALIKDGGYKRNGTTFNQSGNFVLTNEGDSLSIQSAEIIL